jgi:hypothetical protein
MQKTSEAEFFMRLIEGSVCALVDLDERTNVRYVPWVKIVRLAQKIGSQ